MEVVIRKEAVNRDDPHRNCGNSTSALGQGGEPKRIPPPGRSVAVHDEKSGPITSLRAADNLQGCRFCGEEVRWAT